MAKPLLLQLLVTMGCACAGASAVGNSITHIKGFDGPLPFSLETGYVEVDESHGAELFYYFIQAERNPQEDPLILWITGGPGCSSLTALFFEFGPLKLDVAGYDSQFQGGFPRLLYLEDSWTKVSNVIFLDAPVGTGFSYAREPQGLRVSLTGTGRQLRIFLQRWLAQHPEFATNPLYIGGDSYSGYTVAVTALEIANNGEQLNLVGYMVGNAAVQDEYDTCGKVPFLHGMGLISDELYEAARGSCGGEYVTTPRRNLQCANALLAISQVTSGISEEHVLEPRCLGAPSARSPARSRMLLGQEEECREMGYRLSKIWADDAEVRETLGIREGTIGAWIQCADLTDVFRQDVRSTIPYHRNLTQRGYRELVYTGDHDMHITVVGTQAWIRTLGYPVVAPWRPWYTDRQVAGFTTEYAYNLTFATVKGAGHMAPMYRPKECLHMLDRWTSSAGRL